MAKEEFGAKAITLETIANSEVHPDSPRRIAMKRPLLTVSLLFRIVVEVDLALLRLTWHRQVTNEDWYTRHGYRVYAHRKVAWVDVDETGKEWPVGSSMLRKDLV